MSEDYSAAADWAERDMTLPQAVHQRPVGTGDH